MSTRNAGRSRVTGKTITHNYDADVAGEVLGLARRGADADEIAVILNLRPGQVKMHYGHLIEHEQAMRNLEVVEALRKSALGAEEPDTHIAVNLPRGGHEPVITRVPLIKHYPPNVSAIEYWLRNRAADKWHGEGGARVPPDESAAQIRDMLRQMRERTSGS